MCRHPLFDNDGSELREIDLRYDVVRDAQDERFRKILGIGSAAAAAVALLVPLAHLAAAVLVPAMLIAHLVAIRLVLIRDARRYLSPSRRLFSRWIIRLSFLWIGGPGYGMAVVPLVVAAVSGAVFALLTWLAHSYVLHHLARERDRRPLASWEIVTLVALASATVVVLVVLVAAVVVVGWSVSHLLEWLGM